MIYLFGKDRDVSIIYDGNSLTQEAKKDAIIIEQLPPVEKREGYNAILCLDQDNKPYWEYELQPVEEVVV
jgi:hypothetical protein